jgi:plasmid stability protein
MPTPITICEVPDEVREELAARAALSGRTLEEYVRAELIALAQRPSAAVWMARVRARKDALQHPLPDPHCTADGCAAEGKPLESGIDHGKPLESGVDHGISTCRDVG